MAKKPTRRKKRGGTGDARSRKTKAQLLEELNGLQQELERLRGELEASRQQVATPGADLRPDPDSDQAENRTEEARESAMESEALAAQLTEAQVRGEELERALEDARKEISRAGQSARKMQARAETNERRLQTVTRELVELREDTRGVVTRLRVEAERKDRELTDRALRIEALRAEVEALRKRRRRETRHDGS